MKKITTAHLNILVTVSLIFMMSLMLGVNANAQTQTKTVYSWKELAGAIATQADNSSWTYTISSKDPNIKELIADSKIELNNGKNVTITCDRNIVLMRGDELLDDFFQLYGKSKLRVRGGDKGEKLIFDGDRYNCVSGSFVGVRGDSTFYLDKNVTVRNFNSSLNAGAIYNDRDGNTIIYYGSHILNCRTNMSGNSIFNLGYLKICGCDIAGEDNGKEDIYQEGKLEFAVDSSNELNYVSAKIQGGIKLHKTINVTPYTAVKSKMSLANGASQIRIDVDIAGNVENFTYVNNSLIDVASQVGAASVVNCFKEGNGFVVNSELLPYDNKIYMTYRFTGVELREDDTIIVGIGQEDSITVYIDIFYKNPLIESVKWTCSDSSNLVFNKVDNHKWQIYGKKYTGPTKPIKAKVTLKNAKHEWSDEVNIIVEKKPQIIINQMRVGSESVLNAPVYNRDKYEFVKYVWYKSEDGGKTWKYAKEGSGAETSCYTTPRLTAESEKWSYKCEICLAVSDEGISETWLESNVISLASLNKGVPSLRLSDKKAVYNGSPINIGDADVSPRTLLGYVDYVYYTNILCTKKTTSANGAKKVGGAPANVGTYYVVANLRETERYRSAQYAFAKFEITKGKGIVEVKNEKETITMKSPKTISLSKNLGNPKFSVKVSKPKLLKAEIQKGKIVCTPLKPGNCEVTITTNGNANVTPSSTSFSVKIRPEKVALKKAYSTEKEKCRIRVKRLKYVTGYQVIIGTKSEFKKKKKSFMLEKKDKKDIDKTGEQGFRELRSGKTYYVKIRGYYRPKKQKIIYGPWSRTLKFKAK